MPQPPASWDVTKVLQQWDHGSKSRRAQILQTFIKESQGKTAPELEIQFSNAASLFLTRLTAWLRLTYMVGTYLDLQLQAIMIFIGSSSGHKFLAEFIEVGGVLTVLEILGLKEAKEEDKAQALKLLRCISAAGRKYKELICESFGVRAVAECLAKSNSIRTQDSARNLLQELAIITVLSINNAYIMIKHHCAEQQSYAIMVTHHMRYDNPPLYHTHFMEVPGFKIHSQ